MVKSASELELCDRLVVGLADEYESGFVDPRHVHKKTQILYASSGVMSVVTDTSSFVIPPRRAVWIPHNVIHEVSCRGAVSLRTLYIDPSFRRENHDCHIIEVGQLLHALIVETATFPPDYPRYGRESMVVELLLKEISLAHRIPYSAPMPKDPRLLRVCHYIVANPADNHDINYLADLACMSRRSFTRIFKKETGMGVAVWRQQVRLLEALSLLSTGNSVTRTALDVGYESASAFSTMFQKAFGIPPSKYPF